MSAPLSSIFAAVNTLITSNLAAESIAPTFGTGGVDRQFASVSPRIVWVPTDEDIGAARGQGGDTFAGNPPIASRTVTVECDVWGDDRDTVDEFMIDAVFSAVHDICSQGSYGVLRARWLLPEESSKAGEVYRIWFQFFVPVKRVTPQTTTAVINAFPETPQIDPIVGP